MTGQREHPRAWEGKWEKTKRGGTEGGLHIRHAEEETEIKRREREKRDTQDFPGTRKAKVKDQNDRGKEGIKQGISIFA